MISLHRRHNGPSPTAIAGRRALFITALAATTAVTIAACSTEQGPRAAAPVFEIEPVPEIEPVLDRLPVTAGDFRAGVEFEAQVDLGSPQVVDAEVAGTVDRSASVAGQAVDGGEPLVWIRPLAPGDPLTDAFRIAELELALAEATGAGGRELARKRAALEEATQAFESRGADGSTSTGQGPEAVPAVAPAAGVVTANLARVGSTVVEGQPLVIVGDPDQPVAIAQVEPTILDRLAVGDDVTIAPVARDSPAVGTGTIISIDPGTGEVRARLPADTGIDLGRFARLSRSVGTGPDSVFVDSAGIRFDDTGPYAIVVGPDDTTERRRVELGVTDGERVEVLGGLAGGETVLGP